MGELRSVRRDFLATRISDFKAELAKTAISVGRDPAEINLITVTKGFPASDLELLAELGVADIGESKDQEVIARLSAIKAGNFNLHFIGQLQRNKIKSICSYSAVIHSVDRMEIVRSIATAAKTLEVAPGLLLQVDLAAAKNPNRGGVDPAKLLELAASVASSGLSLLGLMAVAPLGEPVEAAFERFGTLSEQLQSEYPTATCRSIGMSGDWQVAVSYGATHLRIGSALLGNRG
jgi:pyridoxal phosphate enzyme (YggS family)